VPRDGSSTQICQGGRRQPGGTEDGDLLGERPIHGRVRLRSGREVAQPPQVEHVVGELRATQQRCAGPQHPGDLLGGTGAVADVMPHQVEQAVVDRLIRGRDVLGGPGQVADLVVARLALGDLPHRTRGFNAKDTPVNRSVVYCVVDILVMCRLIRMCWLRYVGGSIRCGLS
jgi:hypothetical protein